MRRIFTIPILLILTLVFSLPGLGQACPDVAGACPPPSGNCLSWVDLVSYFVPTYSGWQTTRLTEQATLPSPSTTYDRLYMYGTDKLAHIKGSDPFSVETYTWDTHWIYLTAENGINNSSQTRIYPVGDNILGLIWMPRLGCASASPPYTVTSFNQFTPCYYQQVYYNNCNSCPCQYSSTDPQHCSVNPSYVFLTSYDFGGSIGTIPTLIKQDSYDDGSGGERYYYGQGYGFLRYEAFNAQEQLVSVLQEAGMTPNDPSPADQACFHP